MDTRGVHEKTYGMKYRFRGMIIPPPARAGVVESILALVLGKDSGWGVGVGDRG